MLCVFDHNKTNLKSVGYVCVGFWSVPRRTDPSYPVPHLRIVSGTRPPLSFHLNLRIILSLSTKCLAGILTGVVLSLQLALGGVGVFPGTEPPVQERDSVS